MENQLIPDEIIMNKIFYIRGQKVMLDKDLAELYSTETKKLKQQVNRNLTRFPKHYMFELTKEENEISISPRHITQLLTSAAHLIELLYTWFVVIHFIPDHYMR
jgi:hypothetical protein